MSKLKKTYSKKNIISTLFKKFPDLFNTYEGNLNAVDLIKLKSKRNLVFEIIPKTQNSTRRQALVVKVFKNPTAHIEVNIINHLKQQNIPVPFIRSFEDPYLILEKIEGYNLCDFINQALSGTQTLDEITENLRRQLSQSIHLLAQWFATLHRKNIIEFNSIENIIVLNKGNTRLRDFIINPSTSTIYGLDFEQAYEGNYLEDLTWICCSLIDTNPGIFELAEPSHKIELINIFLKEYFNANTDFLFSFHKFSKLLINNLNKVIKRRALGMGNLNLDVIFNKLFRSNSSQ
ncbi:MAG: hypothetical protein BAJALOKI1v1_480010 [Promethearchaeota archaeon]|nr:MAG: hypothetical protein BAJALOKI1v1_480010 [Candidatus Lokiarchaeota archaeon]